jgi:hypothetical protein
MVYINLLFLLIKKIIVNNINIIFYNEIIQYIKTNQLLKKNKQTKNLVKKLNITGLKHYINQNG